MNKKQLEEWKRKQKRIRYNCCRQFNSDIIFTKDIRDGFGMYIGQDRYYTFRRK